MKQKKFYIDILRIVAIFMIFHFHFAASMENYDSFLWKYTNGEWGCVGTTLFFLISGNCLARNYEEKLNIKSFYIKRWFAIFPAFYLCYLIALFCYTVLLHMPVLSGMQPWRILFTILGIDNYMNFLGIRNCSLVGEWYTAVILGIYLLFPVLRFLYKKSKLFGTVLIMSLYILNILFTWGPFPDDAHLITGVSMFWIGMLLYHFETYLEKLPWYLWSGIFLIEFVLLTIQIPGPQLILKNLMGICIFLTWMKLGNYIKRENIIMRFLSKIEYGIYLCHHTVLYIVPILYMLYFANLSPLIYYILSLIITIVFATLITYLTKWLTKFLLSFGLFSQS